MEKSQDNRCSLRKEMAIRSKQAPDEDTLLNSPATLALSQLQSIRSRQSPPVSFMVGHDLAASMDETTTIYC